MSQNNQLYSGIRAKIIIISLAILVAGLFALYVTEACKERLGSFYTVLSQLAQILTISALFACISEWLLRSDYMRYLDHIRKDIQDNTATKDNIQSFGLVEIANDANEHQFRHIIETTENLTISMNHGRTWLSQKSEYFKHRFASAKRSTVFVFADPDGTAAASIAQKEGKSRDDLSRRVDEAISIIRAAGGNGTNVKIYLQPYYTCQTIVLADDSAIVTPYCNSSGRYTVPLFVYRDMGETSYCKQISVDLGRLIAESKDVTSRLGQPQPQSYAGTSAVAQ